jgi:hypothetical protein
MSFCAFSLFWLIGSLWHIKSDCSFVLIEGLCATRSIIDADFLFHKKNLHVTTLTIGEFITDVNGLLCKSLKKNKQF